MAPDQNGQPAGEDDPQGAAPDTQAPEASGVLETARRLLLGGVAMTFDEINEVLQRLMGRGALSEADVTRLVQEYVENRAANGEAAPGALARTDKQSALQRSVETILVRLNVPTRSDIEELSRKITLLNDKVTRLQELRRSGAGRLPTPSRAEPERKHNGGAH